MNSPPSKINSRADEPLPKDLMSYVWSLWPDMKRGFYYILAGTVIIGPIPFFFRLIVDEYVSSGNVHGIGAICLLTIGLLVLHYMFTMKGMQLNAKAITRCMMEMRARIFQKLQFLHFGYLDRQKTGRLISKYAFDTQTIEGALVPMVNNFLPQILHGSVMFLLLCFLDWRLSVAVLFFLPIYGISRAHFFKKIQASNRAVRIARENLTGTAAEYISALRLVRGYGQERSATVMVDDNSASYAQRRSHQMILNQLFNTFSFVSTQVLTLLVIAGGGYFVIAGQLTIGTLFAFMAAMPFILAPIQLFTTISQQYFNGKESYYSINELISSHYVEKWKGTNKIQSLQGRVVFNEVSFSYENSANLVINQLNLEVEPGEHVALVGPSGSGKSTIANLLLGLYSPLSGTITIDGVAQANLNMRWLRRQCAIVMQESILFSGSVLDNLRFAYPRATEEEIYEAARQANAHDFILELPEGYQTSIGERGVALSGGQRQRLSIARAILRNPRILILDEATSALDYRSERLIQEALERLAHGRTVITIAHRLSTIKNADRIVVLQKGKVIESGPYTTLAESGGYFQALLAAQGELG